MGIDEGLRFNVNSKNDHFNFWQRAFYRIIRGNLSDVAYANMSLRRWFGGGNIREPKTFNEKLQWLKIYNRNPLWSKLADKYAVRDYVNERIGKDFLNDLLGVWDHPSEIDWSALPDSFVLKATHGSGTNILVKDKAVVDQFKIQEQLTHWLAMDYSQCGREWVYREIPRRIIAERFLYDATGGVPQDFKIFCFNGEPRYIQVDVDRFGDHRRAYYDVAWQRQPYTILHEQYDGDINKPQYIETMLKAARALAQDIPFVRVDFYALPKIVFGEMTFYPENGTGPFEPSEWDLRLGELLELPVRLHEDDRLQDNY